MSFKIRDLSILAYAQGFTLWHYKAHGVPLYAVRDDPHYFDDAVDMMATGDMVLVSTSSRGALMFVTHCGNGLSLASMT